MKDVKGQQYTDIDQEMLIEFLIQLRGRLTRVSNMLRALQHMPEQELNQPEIDR